MTPDEIKAALQAAFKSCDVASCPLTEMQKQILLQVVEQIPLNSNLGVLEVANPLDELTPEELAAFLQFVKTKEEYDGNWKAQFLNDWLHDSDSGEVQFIRERYGIQWLNRLRSHHFDKYVYFEDALKLRVGDRIEISNAIWEWVQDDGPCKREWFACVVLQVEENRNGNGNDPCSNCIVRLNNGAEYEIQGIYEWNRYNWRWSKN
ncbi:MAG: hypothetical protein RMX68_016545 [Aulosira sp. ZfuVER01]|nr:hypothetical protein [Aulosira sp. ZfuVER01]MDZ8000853.1 hypothetical protein [Aulosira sp. DedVER01a]MDZ8055876.1 hypothetical protein [Aulosira sp. ZfuCHP01]